MDNATALQRFEQSLRRRFPGRSTPVHYVSHVRKFQRVCSKPWAEVTVPVTTIQCLLGHHDLRTTQRYAHVMDKTAQQQYHAATPALALHASAVQVWAFLAGQAQTGRPVHGPTPSILLTRTRVMNPAEDYPSAGTSLRLVSVAARALRPPRCEPHRRARRTRLAPLNSWCSPEGRSPRVGRGGCS